MTHRDLRPQLCLPLCLVAVLAWGGTTVADEPRPNKLSEAEIADGWILLFDGGSLFGWQPTSEANWRVQDGAIHVSEGERGLLLTTSEFADYELHVDFRAPQTTNSGVFLHTMSHPTDPATDCYEVNIAPLALSPFPTGSVVGRQKRTAGEESSEWRTFAITLVGGRLRIELDGQQVVDYTDPAPLGRGHIGLQLNEGEVAFRNIKLRPLGTEPIFNGRDLTGWHVTPDHKSEFSVTDEGYLHVVNGSGQLESEGEYDDFALQLEVIANGKHLNSGIFFRSIPGLFWQGYESQIQNGYEDGDRTVPSDFGTGGIYRRQKARRVVASDFKWFAKTIVATGPHMAVWVNGFQVSDWTDERPPHENPREGLRTEPGTLSIQGHDPTTDLMFRNIRIETYPPRREPSAGG
ncbi:MAG: DUF1080 domain-containing protein [Pirellulales bacterium]